MEVTPEPAIGDLGGSIDIKWTIRKVEPSDKAVNTRMYIGSNFTAENLIYQGLAGLSEGEAAKDFGDRIKATFVDSTFTLTLSNLSYNDTITFTLLVNAEDALLNPRPVIITPVKIIEVRGRYLL